MGMSTYIVGFKPTDETWEKYKKIWDACEAAEIDPPDEVVDYFGGESPDDSGVEVELEDCVEDYNYEERSGYEVDIKKLPKHVTKIRFYNSW